MPSSLEAVAVSAQKNQSDEFSLVLGGPLYQLLRRSKLNQASFGNLGWRIAVITALAWLPLAPLTMIGGRFADGVPVPFLYDFEVHARLLFSVPLMVLAELVVHVRMRAIAAQFVERHIITQEARPAFDAVLSSAVRLRNALAPEIAILALVFLAGPLVWRGALALRSDTWYATA